jgi:hypothetical protein
MTMKLVRFDWAMKHLLRDKANYSVLEGFLSVLLNEKVIIKKILSTRSHTVWLIKCFVLSRTILLDSVEFGKLKLKSTFKNLHNYLKINILAKKAKNTEGVTFLALAI